MATTGYTGGVNTRDSEGNTKLMQAVIDGNEQEVARLVKYKSIINAKNRDGKTAIMIAAEETYSGTRILKILIAAHAKLDEVDNDGSTALMWATYSDNAEAVKILLKAGAGKDLQDSRGKTAVMFAVESDKIQSLNALIAAKVNLEIKDETGWTAMHWAASTGSTDSLKAIIRAGAKKDIQDSDGWTPLAHAVDRKYLEVVKLLLSSDADPTIKTNDQKTPFDIAREDTLPDRDILYLLKNAMDKWEAKLLRREEEKKAEQMIAINGAINDILDEVDDSKKKGKK